MEQVKKPVVTFLLPYRMFREDRAFLGDNLERRIAAYMGEDGTAILKGVTAYTVTMAQQGYRPVPVEISEREMQKLLKPVFPHGKCISCESYFVQTKSKTMLPVIDFQLFF